MPSSQAIVPHLPFLRRYARALTGSQASGDAAVRATLEAIIQDPSLCAPPIGPRVSLYRVFHAIWTTTENPSKRRMLKDGAATGIGARLAMLGVVPREALLLTMMEGFSPEDAASILGCSVKDLVELVQVAMAELRPSVPASILIIEDEPVISLDLAQLVTEMGHTVFGVARTRSEAVKAVRDQRPDLILADVHLADDSSGIDAVNDILLKFDVPTIFITAFPERLLTGEQREPAYLITKPFVPENVKTIIGHALSVAEKNAAAAA